VSVWVVAHLCPERAVIGAGVLMRASPTRSGVHNTSEATATLVTAGRAITQDLIYEFVRV